MTTENPLLTMIREVCSLGRAELQRPRTRAGDDDAQRALVIGLRAMDLEGHASDIAPSVPLLAPRAPYFDGLVLDALAGGVLQIVNLGAGYDDRALRFRNAGTTYFELDLPELVAAKTRRLAEMEADLTGVRLIGCDLARDDAAEVLAEAGHDATQPTLFIAEHLVLFLSPGDVARLLSGIAGRAAARSRFAFTAEIHPVELDSADVTSTIDTDMFDGAGPVHTVMSFARWKAVLDESGWSVSDAERVVDHFALPLDGRTIQIRTRFVTADLVARPRLGGSDRGSR